MINTIFGISPFIGATLIATMREDSGPYHTWLSIVGDWFCSHFPQFKQLPDPTWLRECGRSANNARYDHVLPRNILMRNAFPVAIMANLPGNVFFCCRS